MEELEKKMLDQLYATIEEATNYFTNFGCVGLSSKCSGPGISVIDCSEIKFTMDIPEYLNALRKQTYPYSTGAIGIEAMEHCLLYHPATELEII